MNLQLFSAYLLITLVLVVAPGPIVTLVVTTGATRGVRPALATVVGTTLGNALLLTAIAFGLTWVLANALILFEVMRWAGAAYLVYLGVQAWRGAQALHDHRCRAQVAFRLPVDPAGDDLGLARRSHAESTTLRGLEGLAQSEGAPQPRQIGAATSRRAGRTDRPMRGPPASPAPPAASARWHAPACSRAPRSARPRRRDRRPAGNAATALPPAGSGAAATGRRRGWCRCACRPAGRAPWRTARARRGQACVGRFDVERAQFAGQCRVVRA